MPELVEGGRAPLPGRAAVKPAQPPRLRPRRMFFLHAEVQEGSAPGRSWRPPSSGRRGDSRGHTAVPRSPSCRVGPVGAAQDLHESALAAPFSPIKRVHLPGAHLKGDALQGAGRPKLLRMSFRRSIAWLRIALSRAAGGADAATAGSFMFSGVANPAPVSISRGVFSLEGTAIAVFTRDSPSCKGSGPPVPGCPPT